MTDSAQAYDSLASRYDNLLLDNLVLAHSARVSLGLTKAALMTSQRVLEIGCGTGRETLELASLGKTVVACDPSKESLDVLRLKAQRRKLSERVLTRAVSAAEVNQLVSEFGQHTFDGAYAREIVLLAPMLFPRRALSRLEGRMELPVDRHRVVIRSYTPNQIRKMFSPLFSLRDIWAIPAIIPPHYMHRILRWSGPLRSAWEEADIRVNHRWPLKVLGSHTAYLFTCRP